MTLHLNLEGALAANHKSRLTHANARRLFLVVIWLISLLLVTYRSSLITRPALAADPPNPKPCENAVATDKLTDHYVTDENGSPFGITDQANTTVTSITVTGTGPPGATVTAVGDKTLKFTLDMSKLQSIFADTNSNYLEGRYQSQDHQQAPLLQLDNQNRDNFFGPGQKAAPKVMTDQLRTKYVNYVYNKPTLAESANTITDVNGQNPMTIYDMVQKWGLPDPASATFQSTWGPYWVKIPTAYSEFYEGKLEFRAAIGNDWINAVKSGSKCPESFDSRPPITFIMPSLFRATATSGQLNQIIVPKIAQSPENNLILASTQNIQNTLAQIIKRCVYLASQNPLTKALKKAVSSINTWKITPVKNAYAATPNDTGCVKVLGDGRSSTGPYCALPAGQLPPEACSKPNANDPNQLDPQNTNVVCEITFTFSKQMTLPISGNGQWDNCTYLGGTVSCTATASIWADFRIPWIGEIWNNTLASDTSESLDIQSPQQTGRPGVYAFFTPNLVLKSANQDPKAVFLQSLLDQCKAGNCSGLLNWVATADSAEFPDVKSCVERFLLDLVLIKTCTILKVESIITSLQKLPGQVGGTLGVSTSNVLGASSGEGKQPLIGSTDCLKVFVRDMALKPLVLQKYQNIDTSCIPKPQATTTTNPTPPQTPPATPIPTPTPTPAPTPTPTPTPIPTQTPAPAVFCSTASSTIATNAPATFNATGGNGTYTWSVTGGNPASDTGSSFTTQFATAGNYVVLVTSGGSQGGCNIAVKAPNTSLTFSWARPPGVTDFADVAGNTSRCTSSNTSCSTPPNTFWPNTWVIYNVRANTGQGPIIKTASAKVAVGGIATATWDWTYVAVVYPSSSSDCYAAGNECKVQTISNNSSTVTTNFSNLKPATTYQETVCTPNCGTGMVIFSRTNST